MKLFKVYNNKHMLPISKSENKYLFYKPTSVSLPIIIGKEEKIGIYFLI